ncbi:MAG: hypothetical protein KGP28_00830 [Bdellovibrionales bacterium]|nr:hypothetical protein [Bdellovibrionales bacterium]
MEKQQRCSFFFLWVEVPSMESFGCHRSACSFRGPATEFGNAEQETLDESFHQATKGPVVAKAKLVECTFPLSEAMRTEAKGRARMNLGERQCQESRTE